MHYYIQLINNQKILPTFAILKNNKLINIKNNMVIQRWQSVFLFFASIMMGFYSFLPLATQGDITFLPYKQPVYLILNILIALLSLVSIFLYKNLSRQKLVVKVNIFLILFSAIVGATLIYLNMPNVEVVWTAGPLLLLCSFLMSIAAMRRINHDDKLLKAADRIR